MTLPLPRKRRTTAPAPAAAIRIDCRQGLVLLLAAILSLAVSHVDAAILKWKPYRPVTTAERAAAATGAKQAVQQAAAKQVEREDPLADPFQDKDKPTTPADDEALNNLKLEGEPDPIEGAPRLKPDATDPGPLQPADDYFPEEAIPAMPDDEPAPNSSPSLSDELRELDKDDKKSEDCKDEKADCADALTKLKLNTLANIDLNINVSGAEGQDFPCECPFGTDETFEGRHWNCVTYTWKASGLCHKPLYFEQVAVERYGHSAPTIVQDVLCGAHFFATLPILPYAMGLCPHDECQYSLGYYRPGNCAPYIIDPIPLSLRAGLFEAGAIVGGILIIP